jgi:trimeric autotransporter adhesin
MPKLEIYDGSAWTPVGTGSGTVTSITAGTGLNGGTITTTGTIDLANTAITAGSFVFPSTITFDAQGRATAATAGTAPVTSVTGTTNQVVVTGTTTPVVSLSTTMVTPGTITSTGSITANTVDFIKIAVGTTAQRPGTPTAGMMRLNTSL